MKTTNVAFKESLKDSLANQFIIIGRTSDGNKTVIEFKELIKQMQEEVFDRLIKESQEMYNNGPDGYPYSIYFENSYKAWLGILFRIKCKGSIAANYMHPFDYFKYVQKMNKESIAEHFSNRKGVASLYRVAIKTIKKLRANSMIKDEDNE